MTRARITIAAVALAALALVGALASGLAHIDRTRGTYGLSIGSNTRYCSLELNVPISHGAHGGGLDEWCQAGG